MQRPAAHTGETETMDIETYIARNIDISTREGREVRMSPDAHGFTVRVDGEDRCNANLTVKL